MAEHLSNFTTADLMVVVALIVAIFFLLAVLLSMQAWRGLTDQQREMRRQANYVANMHDITRR